MRMASVKATAKTIRSSRTLPPYSSKIIKAGALLPDTRLLLAHWDLTEGVSTNLLRFQQTNLLGKASRSRATDILAIFRQRYLADRQELAALVTLVQADVSPAVLVPILYFLTLQADPLLRDVVEQVLTPMLGRGDTQVHTAEVVRWLGEQARAGRTQGAWSEPTQVRIAQGILATLRDFGVLHGKVNKRVATLYLPVPSFAFLAFLLNKKQRSGERLLHHPAWRVFFLAEPAVERLFLEAHQERLLEYHAAGRVIRIEFPAERLEEYAHALTQRPH
jgi:hypothetical protein